MPWTGTYDELQEYLRQFINFKGGPVEYDFNGVVQLMLAALDNLRRNALEDELDEVGEMFSDEQANFLLKLADHIRRGRSI
jgi:hypothetical protein